MQELDVFDIPLAVRAKARISPEDVYSLIDGYDFEPPKFSPRELVWDLRRTLGAEIGFPVYRSLVESFDPFDDATFDSDPRGRPDKSAYDAAIAREWDDAERDGPSQFDRLLVDELEWRRRGDAEDAAFDRKLTEWHHKHPGIPTIIMPQNHLAVVPSTPAPDLIKTSAEFMAGFTPPDYLVDGILQRRFFYSVTAQTGAGKTSLALLLTALVATGKPLGDIAIERGEVLYFAGENPNDVQMRWLGLSNERKFDPALSNVHWLEGARNLAEAANAISQEVARKGLQPALVVVDTAAAYNFGDDENSNAQAVTYARLLRTLTDLPGGPCVLVLCHPTKNATDDNLVPRGGGAFLAEVDGNIAVKRRESTITLAAQGKFRGSEGWSISCALRAVGHPKLRDTKGRSISTVVAEPISEAEKQIAASTAVRHENLVLKDVEMYPEASIRDRARRLNWLYANGKPAASKVERALHQLKREKLVKEGRNRWELTSAGEQELNRLDTGPRQTGLTPIFPSVAPPATGALPMPPEITS